MKKLFISQPMRGRAEEEILAERKNAIETAKWMIGEDVEAIDSFFSTAPTDAKPLWYLGKSIELLSSVTTSISAQVGKMQEGAGLNMKARYSMELI